MAKKKISMIGRSLKTGELLNHKNPEFKKTLNEGLKKSIVEALKADEELSKAIGELPLDAEALKNRPLDKVIEGIKDKLDAKHLSVIGDYLSKDKDEKETPKINDLLGLDVPISENSILTDALLKYNATKLGNLVKVKSLDVEKELPYLLNSSVDQRTLLLQQWKVIKKWTNAEMSKLENSIDLLRVVDNQVDFVSALANEGIEKTADLAFHNGVSLKAIFKKAKIEIEDEKAIENFANEILLTVEKEYPSAFFMHRLAEKPTWLGLEAADRPNVSNNFKDFYLKNKTFDLKNEPIISLETGLLNDKIKGTNPTPALIGELALAQQALQISPDTDIAALLMARQVNIHKVVNTTHNSLMRELDIDAVTAIQIKDKAQHYHEVAMNGFFAYRDLHSNPFIKNILDNLSPLRDIIKDGIGNNVNWDKIKNANGLKELNSIEDLFGSQNYCECDSCQSVLSAAAYFVDLMRFIEQRVLKTTKGNNGITETILEDNHPIHLKVRRPDLWELPLTCDNTNKRIPYIEIVNEVLSKFTEKQLGKNPSVSQRLLKEKPNNEFILPFNLPLEEVKVWLSYLKIKRIDLLKYLYPNPGTSEKLEIALERLNLSKETYKIIIDDTLDAVIDKDVFLFRHKSGLSPEETEKLADLKFWDDKLVIQQIKDNADFQKFKLEFKSTLSKWQGKIHRLIRLWKATGWNLTELDIAFQTFDLNHDNLNATAIQQLALFKELQGKTGLSAEVLSGILKGISRTQSEGKNLTWDCLLPLSWVNNRNFKLELLQEGVDEDAVKILLELQGIFGVNTHDILGCLSFLMTKTGDPLTFSLSNLDTFFRYIQLYKWSNADNFDEFAQILKIWDKGQNKFLNLTEMDILSFIDFVQYLPFRPEDLIFLFGEGLTKTSVIEEDKEALESKVIKDFVNQSTFSEPEQFELFFNQWLGIEKGLLSYYKNFIEVQDTVLVNLFKDLQNDNTKAQTYIALSNIKNKLERLTFLFEFFKIDLDTQNKIAANAKEYKIFKLGFNNWGNPEWIKELVYLGQWITETKKLSNFDLIDLLAKMDPSSEISLNEKRAIAKWHKVSLAQTQSVLTSSDSIREIQLKWDKLTWMKLLNMNGESLNKFKADTPYVSQSELIQHAIRSKYEDNETWEASIQDFKNTLSSKLRDALCNFVIFHNKISEKGFGFKDRESLYQYFLLDVGMGDCFTLPRIVVATNSLQVYIHRCIMGLELSADEKTSVLLDIDEIQEWEWRKNFRVWEANRKIFLYPENYAEAEIRDNKSPEFKELEDELLQQKLDLEVVENAYKKYLEQIMTLAELRMAGAYFDRSSNRIYIFGKTNKQPTEFYYRHLEFLESGGVIWSNWEKMNIAIPAPDVSAIMHNGKLHIFWTTYQRKDISSINNSNSEISAYTYDVFLNYSYLKVDKKWSPPQKVELGHRSNSPFDAFLRIDGFEEMVTKQQDKTVLTEEGEKVRENVLKEFEQTVYRKPYPMHHSDKKNLNLCFIYTDQEDALKVIYKYSEATIDSFKVSIKIVVDYLILKVEQDLEFSFDRIERKIIASSLENARTDNFNIPSISYPFVFGADKLNFILEFKKKNSGGFRFELKSLRSSGNKLIRFKKDNEVVKSGDVDIYHQIDYVPVSKIDYVTERVDIVNQSLLKGSKFPVQATDFQSWIGAIRRFSGIGFNFSTFGGNHFLEPEYNSYFDNFTNFHVTDGSSQFTNTNRAVKIQQKNLVSVLTTPTKNDPNDGYNLNPGQIQMLWEKISLGLADLMDTLSSQRHVQDQIDYSQSFGNYFFELFFHIPMRIADHLNAAGKYKEANYWYSFIYNPTAIKDKFEQLAFPHDVNWRFAAFRNLSIEKLKDIYSNPDTIEMYRRYPGNPHAIARLRIGAYQKHVVMKYLDNLLDWADNLFEQFTPESTSEARYLYSVVKTILGNKPQSTGKCGEPKEITYNNIKNAAANEFVYNLFTFQGPAVEEKRSSEPVWNNKTEEGRSSSIIFRSYSSTPAKYTSKTKSNTVIDFKQPVTTAAKTKVGFSKVKDIKAISVDIRFNSLRPNKGLQRPTRPMPFFNLEKDLVFCFPHNKDFINYWDRADDRIYKLNHCLDINGVKKVMPSFAPEIDPMLLARMVAGGLSFDDIIGALNSRLPHHRFVYLIEKAKQYTNTVQGFGQALFAAIEKKDGEELTLLRARHEQNILNLTTQVKKKQVEQAKTSLQVLLENKKGIEIRKAHYENLIENELIPWERSEQIAKWTAGGLRIGESIFQITAAITALAPQVGSPFAMKYGGVELSGSSEKFAGSLDAIAKMADNVAMLAGMEAGHQRREQEWQFQVLNTSQDIISIYEQIRNAEIALQVAEMDLEIHTMNIAQYQELYDFYTSKFSGFNHYTFQVRQMQQLYRMVFNLAQDASLQAQKAFEFERHGMEISSMFVKNDNWNNEKLGLLAGERLQLQLMQMEQEFINTDKRKIEITQHFSMLQLAPDKILELKINGECSEFKIPEAAFDLVYPGYFRRIIKSVRISIPCIAGPYTNIGATLTLGNNKIRSEPNRGLDDFDFKGCETIATSTAQNDGGQFELTFRDEKYLPYEGAGAVSAWTLSLPKNIRPFDYNTISDVIFHISYTAEYDGVFKDTVETGLATELNKLNDIGMFRIFSMHHDFPLEWNRLHDGNNANDVILELRREHFPFFANVDTIKSIGPKAYSMDANNSLTEEEDNLGIKKKDKMKVEVPVAIADRNIKDLIFFVKYEC